MKRAISLLLAVMLTLALVACGGSKNETKDVDVEALAAELAGKVKFESDEMRKMSAEDLTNYLDVPQGAQTAFYMGDGMTMEEIIVVKCADDKGAAALKSAIETLLVNQIDSVRQYHPEAVPRLENPVLTQKGAYVVLCVTDDAETAEKIVKEYLG